MEIYEEGFSRIMSASAGLLNTSGKVDSPSTKAKANEKLTSRSGFEFLWISIECQCNMRDSPIRRLLSNRPFPVQKAKWLLYHQ